MDFGDPSGAAARACIFSSQTNRFITLIIDIENYLPPTVLKCRVWNVGRVLMSGAEKNLTKKKSNTPKMKNDQKPILHHFVFLLVS